MFHCGGSRQIFDLNIFTRAFEKTLVALKDATQAVPELKTFNLTDFENHDTVKAFGAAEALIKDSFISLNVSLVR